MFEKDAEEYANEYGQDAFTQVNMPQWIKPIRMERKLGFQKGAEFGYNKANEWHYVKDGDLPKDFGYYLVALKSIAYKGFVFEVVYFTGSIFTKEGEISDNVYAWKEIVLPKESE